MVATTKKEDIGDANFGIFSHATLTNLMMEAIHFQNTYMLEFISDEFQSEGTSGYKPSVNTNKPPEVAIHVFISFQFELQL